jgi:hypothetical protein
MQLSIQIAGKEIKRHIDLLIKEIPNLKNLYKSPSQLIIIALYCILFLPHVFIIVGDYNFVLAYEVDPGSIIKSIISLYQNYYNMNAAYHSSFYGWTYYVINFVLLLPLFIAKSINLISSYHYIFIGIRLILFLIGLLTVAFLYKISDMIFKNSQLSFLAAVLYIASPVTSQYFYTIHPESTGILFMLISIICLLRFSKTSGTDERWYFWGLISCVLSTLAKHVFLITSLSILISFYYAYCYYQRISILMFIRTKTFLRTICLSILVSICLFFIINPFAFIQPIIFINNQRTLFSVHTGGSLLNSTVLRKWFLVINEIPMLYCMFVIVPVLLLVNIFQVKRDRFYRVLCNINLLTIGIFVISIITSSSYIISNGYFAPIYILVIIAFLSFFVTILSLVNKGWYKLTISASITYIVIIILIFNFSKSITNSYNRFMYQNTLIYKVYSYIDTTIPDKSKIAYDLFVTYPSYKKIIGCQFWQGCGTDYIDEFSPDYVMFNKDWKFNDEITPETKRLLKYVQEHNFVILTSISDGSNVVDIWGKDTTSP